MYSGGTFPRMLPNFTPGWSFFSMTDDREGACTRTARMQPPGCKHGYYHLNKRHGSHFEASKRQLDGAAFERDKKLRIGKLWV